MAKAGPSGAAAAADEEFLSGLCKEDKLGQYLGQIIEPQKNRQPASTNRISYEDWDLATHPDKLSIADAPVCYDLTIEIEIEDIKDGVRLTDHNAIRVYVLSHGVSQKEWPRRWPHRWPHDFMLDGEIRPNRCPIGPPVLIRATGIVFYPVFRGYLILGGGGLRRYNT